jgi:hypothetical protein
MQGATLFVATLLTFPLGVWLSPPWESLFPFWAVYFVVFVVGVFRIQEMRLRGFALIIGAFLASQFVSFLSPCNDCDGSNAPSYLLLAVCIVAGLAGVRLLLRKRTSA